jgi:hypothetical protein
MARLHAQAQTPLSTVNVARASGLTGPARRSYALLP